MLKLKHLDGAMRQEQLQARYPTPAEFRVPLRQLVALKREIDRHDEAIKAPPCVECGAMTAEEAGTRCRCAGDKDDCHGCSLWPD